MDIRKLNPSTSAPADRAADSKEARRIHDARRASEAREVSTRAANADVVDTTHADKVERIAVRARALIDDRSEKVRGREDELRRRGDDADAIRRAARRVLNLLERSDLTVRGDGRAETPDGKIA
ncbi:MAG: hypothetical protein JNL94_10490 [Planctomycetes bacterium]|nr:hypothetical protein [Planctomycetota bacterium]